MKTIRFLAAAALSVLAFVCTSLATGSDWVYYQSTGELFYTGSPATSPFAVGFSGAGSCKNDPNSQCVEDLGPIPRGWYTIGEPSTAHGWKPEDLYITLTPDADNDMCNSARDGFLIHGDNILHPGWGSEGCIVINGKALRQQILDAARDGSNRLHVLSGPVKAAPTKTKLSGKKA